MQQPARQHTETKTIAGTMQLLLLILAFLLRVSSVALNSVGIHPPTTLIGEPENTDSVPSELAVSTNELKIVAGGIARSHSGKQTHADSLRGSSSENVSSTGTATGVRVSGWHHRSNDRFLPPRCAISVSPNHRPLSQATAPRSHN
ncbi:hypothetical protein CEE69_12855 [Rhodopirellula bahusiensis]|uniref:Uncharacterized protein n=1 Tax=Rhodopirellula bahusiensis TaxID=2014065 RepID=A0A2G1W6V2_9BACT|nr:hypothetical protein CEE69_12855 [Rhodopirellula bahusiensis]